MIMDPSHRDNRNWCSADGWGDQLYVYSMTIDKANITDDEERIWTVQIKDRTALRLQPPWARAHPAIALASCTLQLIPIY